MDFLVLRYGITPFICSKFWSYKQPMQLIRRLVPIHLSLFYTIILVLISKGQSPGGKILERDSGLYNLLVLGVEGKYNCINTAVYWLLNKSLEIIKNKWEGRLTYLHNSQSNQQLHYRINKDFLALWKSQIEKHLETRRYPW